MSIPAIAVSAVSSPSTALATNPEGTALPFDFAALLADQVSATGDIMLPGPTDKTLLGEMIAIDLNKDEQLAERPNQDGVILAMDPNTMLNPMAAVPEILNQNNLKMSKSGVDQGSLAGTLERLWTDKGRGLPGDATPASVKPAVKMSGEARLEISGLSDPGQTSVPAIQRSFDKIIASQTASGNGVALAANQLTKAEPANLAAKPMEPQENLLIHAGHASAHAVANGATPATTQPNPAADRIAAHLHSPQWSQHLGDKVVWLAKNDQQVAQISINPPQLGPMQISLSLQGDQATAVFASPHAEVRQAIEDAMPRLREMLSSAGISLGGANVGAQLPQQQREQQASFAGENRSFRENDILRGIDEGALITTPPPVNRGRGLVDLFA